MPLGKQCGTGLTVGFPIASLYWMQKFEAQLLERVETLILPKDFLRFKLTGEVGTDETDAAATGIFCVGQRICDSLLISNRVRKG
jgi:xylulokinase